MPTWAPAAGGGNEDSAKGSNGSDRFEGRELAGLSVARDALQVFSGNASRDLGEHICSNLGVELGAADVRNFSDGEILVEIKDNVICKALVKPDRAPD